MTGPGNHQAEKTSTQKGLCSRIAYAGDTRYPNIALIAAAHIAQNQRTERMQQRGTRRPLLYQRYLRYGRLAG